MTPPRDQQSEGKGKTMSEEKSKPTIAELEQMLNSDEPLDIHIGPDGITAVPKGQALNAALAHDEALPGLWEAVQDESLPHYWHIRTRFTLIRLWGPEDDVKAVTAAHNSDRRLLVDALRESPWPVDVWPTTVEAAGQFMQEHMDAHDVTTISGTLMRHGWQCARQAILEALQPYSTQKEGK